MSVITCDTACTVTLVVTPYTATPDDYAAVSEIFGAALFALCLIIGGKFLLRLFQRPTDA